MQEEILEEIGQLIDKLDNGLAATKLPLPDAMHKEGLLAIIQEVKDKLKDIYFDNGGEDVWGE